MISNIQDIYDEIFDKYLDGVTTKELSDCYDIKEFEIIKYLKANGIYDFDLTQEPISNLTSHRINQKRVWQMYQDGTSIKELAIRFACNTRRIENIIRKNEKLEELYERLDDSNLTRVVEHKEIKEFKDKNGKVYQDLTDFFI